MKKPAFLLSELTDFEREKLEQDIFYYGMYLAGFSYSQLKESGWLNHLYSKDELRKTIDSQTSFIPHYSKNNEISIILNTGSYAPAHHGHIEMLLSAEKKLEELGLLTEAVVKILSPSHDKYVLTKSEDIKVWNIDKRLRHLHNLVDEIGDEQLLVDIWESIYCSYPVNFTDVILKYVRDLDKQNIKYKIFYVFGSDNECFLHAFSCLNENLKNKFYGVCVQRDDYPVKINSLESNIIYVDDSKSSHLQSRNLRKNLPVTVDKNIQSFYSYGGFYAVRKDNSSALSSWIDSFPEHKEQLVLTYNDFHNELKKTIHQYLGVEMLTVDLEVQRAILKDVLSGKNIINLDLGTNADESVNQYPLNKGRLFNPSSRQNRPIKMLGRTDCGLKNKEIPPGDYWFVDDDIASGQTYSLIEKELSFSNIKFIGKLNLTKSYCDLIGKDYELFDIVDTKDFLLGTYSGGLICEYWGKAVRVPYFANFVNLYSRASIPHSFIKSFNQDVLKLNHVFFAKNSFLKIKNLEKSLEINLLDVLELNLQLSQDMSMMHVIESLIENQKY